MLDFRWVAGIALWTMLSGPMFVHLSVSSQVRNHSRAVGTVPVSSPQPLARQ